MIDNRTVGKTIATLRQAKGMTQQQLAAVMNVSHQAVSKWENGAALPDIQTLMELTQLFGITVEQLLSGEIPEARLENTTTLDEHLHNIGSFVSGVIDDIGSVFRPESPETPAPDEEEKPSEPSNEGEEEPAETPLAEDFDLDHLLEMAPFMSKGAVEEMLQSCPRKLSAAEIAKFAPFVSGTFLEKMIRDSEPDITWETLRRIAPFLKKEAVDAFARMIATGEKFTKPATEEVNRAAEDVRKAVDDVSKKLGKGMDKAVRKVVQIGESVATEVTKAFDNFTGESQIRMERQANLRRIALERALEDEKWDWIEAHMDEVADEDLKRRIAEKANSLGLQDWVCRNLSGYADVSTIDAAIESGDWGWLSEHAAQFDASLQQRVALAATKAENWQWLTGSADQMDLRDCVLEIAEAARRAGARMLALQLTRGMTPEQTEQMACNAIAAGDFEFFELIADLLTQEQLCKCCIRMGKAGDWENVRRFSEKLSPQSIEWLMEIAIDAGNFDAFDMLDGLLRADGTEENKE